MMSDQLRTMTVADLREIIDDQEIPPDTPVKVRTAHGVSQWEWALEGAHGTLAGSQRVLVLELRSAP